MVAPIDEPLDPRRWFAASVAIVSVAIPVLDNTILNLAVPTILREFHTQLSSLQWVITGYSLTFATLLIIGGRLGVFSGCSSGLFGHAPQPGRVIAIVMRKVPLHHSVITVAVMPCAFSPRA